MDNVPQCQLSDKSKPFGPDQFPLPDFDLIGLANPASLILGGGCFWCTEAVFSRLQGVVAVTSGYAGGEESTANYKAVCGGQTGHAEVIKIEFDPTIISYGQLLKVFFSVAHNPTQLNQQGNDRGTQYRSAVFYTNDAERDVVSKYIRQLDHAKLLSGSIATTLEPLEEFFLAEQYHQNYAELNPRQPYIQGVSQPKVDKLKQYFSDELSS
jgi:peptide-methionine (S)-S-oxide reductase